MNQFYLLCVLLAHATYAAPSIPEPTLFQDTFDSQGWSPRPTDIPHADLLRRGLSPRQLTSGQLVGYFAPDATCGYINGQLGAAITCTSGGRCAAVAAVDGLPGQLGCCPTGPGDCVWYGTCYNYVDFYSSSKCDHACQQDRNVILCTSAANPFCYGYTIPGISATAFGCDSTTGRDTILTTFLGETDGRSFSPAYYTPTGVSTAPGFFPTTTRPSISSAASTSTSTSPVATTRKPKSTPIGAIVGGVVGGIAVVSVAVVGIIFCILRSRKKRKAAATTQPQTMQAAPMAFQPPGGSGVPAQDPRMSYYQTHDMKYLVEGVAPAPKSPAPTYTAASPSEAPSPEQIQYNAMQPHPPVSPQYPPPQQFHPPPVQPVQQPHHHFEMPAN